jgi:photosystem II stability/assembly factor-like uncharacterized protein
MPTTHSFPKILLIGFLVLLSTSLTDAVSAEFDTWKSNGPEIGNIFALAVDPVIPTTLYAGIYPGVFKSTDGGENWRAINTGLPESYILTLAIDPITPTTLYAGTGGFGYGVFKSTDGGENWRAVNTGLTHTFVYTLAIASPLPGVDPATPTTLYAGTFGGGVFKSTDGGESWDAINTGLTDTTAKILAIAPPFPESDPETPATLYVGTMSGVFKSTNGGEDWRAVNNGMPAANVYTLAIAPPLPGVDPLTPMTLYAGTSPGSVFKSVDSGENWNIVNVGLTASYIESLAMVPPIPGVDPAAPNTLYAGTWSDGVFKSTNDGEDWRAVNTGLSNRYVHILAIAPLLPGTDPTTSVVLYAGTDRGVFKSINSGENWGTVNTGLPATDVVNTLAIAPTLPEVAPVEPATLYAGTEYGVFKSTNGGKNWITANTGLTVPTNVQILAIDPLTPTILYAGTGYGVFKSTNGGDDWNPINTGLTDSHLWTLAVDPLAPTVLYAGTWNGGVFKSIDGGEIWQEINAGLTDSDIRAIAVDPLTTTTLYAGTAWGNMFKSIDGGENWSKANTGLTNSGIRALVIDPTTPTILYIGTDAGGVFKSTDGGENWNAANTGLTNAFIHTLAIAPSLPGMDALTPTTLYAGTNGGGVFKSTNGGEKWSTVNTGLVNAFVLALAIDPLTPNHLYAGTHGGGVFAIQQVKCKFYLPQIAR